MSGFFLSKYNLPTYFSNHSDQITTVGPHSIFIWIRKKIECLAWNVTKILARIIYELFSHAVRMKFVTPTRKFPLVVLSVALFPVKGHSNLSSSIASLLSNPLAIHRDNIGLARLKGRENISFSWQSIVLCRSTHLNSKFGGYQLLLSLYRTTINLL